MSPLPVFALLLSLAAPSRAAPSADEQRLYAEGLAAWNAGDARGAERAWAQGYDVAHDPAFLVRVGEAEEKAGASAAALASYRRYLREAPDASDRDDIAARVARLAPPPASPGHDQSEAPREFGAPAVALSAPAVVDEEAARRAADDADSGWNRYNVTAMSATGVGVLLLGTAAFFGAEASSKQGDVNRLQSFRDLTTGAPIRYATVARQYEGALADGRRDAHDARLALLGAAGAAAVAIVFFALDARHGNEAKVALAPVTGGGAVTAAWSF